MDTEPVGESKGRKSDFQVVRLTWPDASSYRTLLPTGSQLAEFSVSTLYPPPHWPAPSHRDRDALIP